MFSPRYAAGARRQRVVVFCPPPRHLRYICLAFDLHPAASGRVYAAYGKYICSYCALWLRVVDGVRLTVYDWCGAPDRAGCEC